MVQMARLPQIAALAVIKIPSNTITKKQTEKLDVGINFTYVGPAQRVYFTAVVTQDTWYSEFDEIGSTKKVIYSDIPECATPKDWILTVPGLPLSGVEPKTSAYGVKVKAEGTFGAVEAGNKACLYVEAPPAVPPKADIRNLDFVATKGTYDIGDRVSFTCSYEYKGKAQLGQLLISVGTGVYPTFNPVVSYNPMEVVLEEAMDWTRASLEGTFLLTEDLKAGQTYNTRARLETLADPTQETDTDWTVFTVAEAVPPEEYTITVRVRPLAGGWVTKEPDKASYAYGDTVKLTARTAPGYKFSYWTVDGEWAGSSTTLNLMVTKDLEVYARYTEA